MHRLMLWQIDEASSSVLHQCGYLVDVELDLDLSLPVLPLEGNKAVFVCLFFVQPFDFFVLCCCSLLFILMLVFVFEFVLCFDWCVIFMVVRVVCLLPFLQSCSLFSMLVLLCVFHFVNELVVYYCHVLGV